MRSDTDNLNVKWTRHLSEVEANGMGGQWRTDNTSDDSSSRLGFEMSGLSGSHRRKMSEDNIKIANRARSRGRRKPSGTYEETLPRETSDAGRPILRIEDFLNPNFDPHDFVEKHLVQRKDCSRSLDELERELEGTLEDILKAEDEAKGKFRSAVHKASNSKAHLTITMDSCELQLGEARKAIRNGQKELDSVLGPLRAAGMDKKALELARKSVLLMLEKTDGIDIETAADLLTRLRVVVRDAMQREPWQGPGESPYKKALEEINAWSNDLEQTIASWFMQAIRQNSSNSDNQWIMAQCARASSQLSGGHKLVEEYINSLPYVQSKAEPIRLGSLTIDQVAKSVVEEIYKITQKIIRTVEEQGRIVQGIFPYPSLIVEDLLRKLLNEKLLTAVTAVLQDLDDHARRTEEKYRVDTTETKGASARTSVAESRRLESRRTAELSRRRYLSAFAEITAIVADCSEELNELCRKYGASVDAHRLADEHLNKRRVDYLEEECNYLRGQIERLFADILEVQNASSRDGGEQFQRIRSSFVKVSSFAAVTEDSIRALLRSLHRCQNVYDSEAAELAYVAICKLFTDKFASVANVAISLAANVLPEEELPMDSEIWTLGAGPVGDYLSLLSSVSHAVSSVDKFLSACGSENHDEEYVTSLREQLRGDLVAIETEVERHLIVGMNAIASRLKLILGREGNQATNYNLSKRESVDPRSILLYIAQLQRQQSGVRSFPTNHDVFNRSDSLARLVDSKDYETLSSVGEEEVSTSFARCCGFLEQQLSLLESSLEGAGLFFATRHLAILARDAVLSHWENMKKPVTALGAIRLIKDATLVLNCVVVDHAELTVLVDVGKLFIVAPDKIWHTIQESGLQTLDSSALASLLRSREDQDHAIVDRLIRALQAFDVSNMDIISRKTSKSCAEQ